MFLVSVARIPVGVTYERKPAAGYDPGATVSALVLKQSFHLLALQVPWVSHALVVTPLAGKPWLP